MARQTTLIIDNKTRCYLFSVFSLGYSTDLTLSLLPCRCENWKRRATPSKASELKNLTVRGRFFIPLDDGLYHFHSIMVGWRMPQDF